VADAVAVAVAVADDDFAMAGGVGGGGGEVGDWPLAEGILGFMGEQDGQVLSALE